MASIFWFMANETRKETVQINFKASVKLTTYLYDLADEEGLGGNPTAVVQHLTWEGIRKLISDGILTRKPGKYPQDS